MVDKSKIKIITFDFDGTTLQKDQTWFNHRTMKVMKECQARGIHVIPCTGRSEDMFPPQLDKDQSFRYWITASGARIVDRLTKEIIYKETFNPEESAEICKLFEGRSLYCEIAAEGRLFFEKAILDELWKYKVPFHHVWYFDTGKQSVIYGKPSDFFIQQNIGIEKINLYGVPENHRKAINAGLRKLPYAAFPDNDSEDIQVFCTHTDNVKAVETLFSHLGCTWENVLSIGDSMLMDRTMIMHAGMGIAMENAPEALKDVADIVAPPCYEDGFARVIEQYIL